MSSSSTSVSTGEAQASASQASASQAAARPAAPFTLPAAPAFIHHPPDLARHRRKCSICRHPERETIDDLFIHWHSPSSIANFYDALADDAEDSDEDYAASLRITWVAIYRHAYALGLDEIRRRNLRFAFEHILEQAGDVTPTSASIMAAARAYAACVNTDGHWNDPPKRVIVTNVIRNEQPGATPPSPSASVGAGQFHPPAPSCEGSDTLEPDPAPAEQPTSSQAFVGADRFHRPAGAPSFSLPASLEIRNSLNPLKFKEPPISNR